MVRATLYLGAAGVMWMSEGYVFARFLGFSRWQTGLMTIMYLALFAGALFLLVRFASKYGDEHGPMAQWRVLSLAPMLVLVIGSFVSLPLLLLILALGRLG